ncbi:hypothetical protein ACFQO1_09310 [Jejudonia soesokkakensis]|uniref:Cell wall anchor protein n=1 Tax=Jejudonia soesokkakensis TaxID=1323432 RepID=A0ABW2MW15_9FLAO
MNVFNPQKTYLALFFLCISFQLSIAQVGIGNTDPDPSSVLDVRSSTQGLLAPRMTTTERLAISSPANSLLVYDTTEKSFYFYDLTNTSWIKLNNGATDKRNNYKLVKSAADLAPELTAGGGSKYLLTSNTYYEINGVIVLTAPIDLNNAYVSGLDANEDILFRSSGNVFAGSTGGSIRNVTITGGGTVFAINGPGMATSSTLLLQNTIIASMASVGSISNIGLFFGNIVNYDSNTTGITYNNIGNLLLNNQGWFDTNNGTFETLTGTFGLVEKVSGFSTVNGSDVAFNVSSSPVVGNGVLNGTVFSGTTTAPSGFVNRYGTGSYSGFNFNNNWTVNAPGIPRESNDVATGNINLTATISSPANTTFTGTGTTSRRKLNGTTTSTNLFRFERSGNNKLIYRGNKNRFFQVNASLSFSTSFPSGTPLVTTYVLYIAKGSGAGTASVIPETKVYGRLTTSTSEVIAVPIVGTIELNTGDFIEVWAERESGNGNIESASLNVTIN